MVDDTSSHPRIRQAHIDEHIAQLRAEIAILSRERNALASIHTLPAEILAEAFVWAHTEAVAQTTLDVLDLVPLWKTLSHTCHHWREISTGLSQIWSVVAYRPALRHWASVALQRVASHPLSVGIELVSTLHAGSQADFVQQIVDRMSVVRRLHIMASMATTPEDYLINALLHSTPAGNLESLNLENISLSRVTLGGEHRQLVDLRLSHCNVSWVSGVLPSRFGELTSLHLGGGGLYRRPESSEFVAMLSSLERLRSLDMRDAGPLRYVATSVVTRMQLAQAHPVQLTSLVIRDQVDALAATLMSLSVPSQTKVFVCIHQWPLAGLSPEHRSALETLGRKRTKLDRSFYEIRLAGHASMSSWTAQVFEDTGEGHRSVDPWLSIEVDLPDRSQAQALDEFFRAFRFSRTISLFIDQKYLTNVPAIFWSDVLQAFDLAKHIHIKGLRPELCAALFFPSPLSEWKDNGSTSRRSLQPHQLPLLNTVVFEGSRFKLHYIDLLTWLKCRKELQNGIQHIACIGCRFAQGDLTAENLKRDVEACVPYVKWGRDDGESVQT